MAISTSTVQPPSPALLGGAPEEALFERGLTAGREWAGALAARTRTFARENPAAFLALGVGAGFLLGKLLLPSRRKAR